VKRAQLHQVAAALGWQVGCGDNSCIWGAPGGMATNGGCRCYGSRGGQSERTGLAMMAEVARALLRYRTIDAIMRESEPPRIENDPHRKVT